MKLIHKRHFLVQHYLLVDDGAGESGIELVAEARRLAEELAQLNTGCRDNFTLIHNGPGLARRACPHVHIVCARTRMQKAFVYFLIALKNVFTLQPGGVRDATVQPAR